MLKLNLLQNALHSLHHGIEHMMTADSDDHTSRLFHDQDHSVEWREDASKISFTVPDFTPPPNRYELKFALLHLIQSIELLLKAFVYKINPDAVWKDSNRSKTIGLYASIKFVRRYFPDLLTKEDESFILQLKDVRNYIEHYEFKWDFEKTRSNCIDCIYLCSLIAQSLHSINIIDAFSWDYFRDKEGEASQYLSTISYGLSEHGKRIANRVGMRWVDSNQTEHAFLCINCGARAVSPNHGDICLGCGADNDENISALFDDNND